MTARRFDWMVTRRRAASTRRLGRRSGACHLILLALALGLLPGCEAVMFKPGASHEAMAADDRTCRAAFTDEAGYAQCMRNRGWFMAGTSVPPVGMGAATQAPKPGALERAGATANDGIAPAASVAPNAAATPAADVDPLTRVNVGGWWKFGASGADLDRAIDTCVGGLGESHRPDPRAAVVTAALRACLRAAGWYALAGSASR